MLKSLNIKYTTLLLALLMALTTAAKPSVDMQVKSQVAEGDRFQLIITLNDMQGQPQPFEIPNCECLFQGAMTTSSMQAVGGKVVQQSRIQLTYTFLAQKAGKVTIPAVTVVASGGQKYTTKQRTLEILPKGSRPSSTQSTQSATLAPSAPDDVPDGTRIQASKYFSDKDVFVRVEINKKKVYEQEPIVATVKLYVRYGTARFLQGLTSPTFEGFLSEDIKTNSDQGTETVNGILYHTCIVKRCVLYPQKAGDLKITSGTYEVKLEKEAFFNSGALIPDIRIMNTAVETSDVTQTLHVEPLPTPRPASFDGAVGNFKAVASLSSTNLRTNEPVDYTIKITGTGNIKYLKTPKLTLPEGFDELTPKTDIDASYSNGDISGSYTATYKIVPDKEGKFEIPPVPFTYFNPNTEKYETIDLKGHNVTVGRGEDNGEDDEAGKMTDIINIHPVKGYLSKTIDRTYFKWWYWMLYVISIAAFVAVLALYRRHIRLSADVEGRRLARAHRKAMRRFKKARDMMARHQAESFYAEISKALFGYISDKLGIPASQLLRENIAERLGEYGLGQDAIDNVINILDDCEMARFTPMSSDTDMAALYNKVVNAVSSIEDVKKK